MLSRPLRAELEVVLRRAKFAPYVTAHDVDAFLAFLDAAAVAVTPARRLPVVVRDPKDERVLAAAIGGRADYLVTGDDDLLVLRDEPKLAPLRIVAAREFVEALARD